MPGTEDKWISQNLCSQRAWPFLFFNLFTQYLLSIGMENCKNYCGRVLELQQFGSNASPPGEIAPGLRPEGWRMGSANSFQLVPFPATGDGKGTCWAVRTVHAKSRGGKEVARVARERWGRANVQEIRWQGSRWGHPAEDISSSPRKTLTALYLLQVFALAAFSVRPTLPFLSSVTATLLLVLSFASITF